VLKRKANLTSLQRFRLRDLLRYNLKTVRAYLLKEDFQQFWEYHSPTWAAKFLDDWCQQVMRSRIEPMKKVAKTLLGPKIRDEILEDAAALGGKGFSAHFGQQRWLVSRQPALRAIFSRYGWDFRGFQTQICRWRLIVRVPKSTTSARDHDVSGMAPPSRMMRAHRSRIVANMSNMAAPICKKICRPWRTILPAV
jgi:hypothetical protein